MRLSLVLLGVLAVVAGCSAALEDGANPQGTDTLLPPPDEPEPGGVPLGDPCQASDNCVSGGICAAPWDGEGAPLVCVGECVANDDPTRWCADDDACCDPDADCGSRGLCQPIGTVDDTGTTVGSTGGDDSSQDGSSGSGSGSDSDSGSGSDSGSETRGGSETGSSTT